MAKPGSLLGNFVRGFVKRSADEVIETFTDAEMIRFGDTAKLLHNCESSDNHLKEKAYSEINKALKKRNYGLARKAISRHHTETADLSCLTTLQLALVEVCTKCTTLLKEALPKKIVIPDSN